MVTSYEQIIDSILVAGFENELPKQKHTVFFFVASYQKRKNCMFVAGYKKPVMNVDERGILGYHPN